MTRWVVAYLAVGFVVSVLVETYIQYKHGQSLPRYGSEDWNDTCFFSAMVAFLWPVAIVAILAYLSYGKIAKAMKCKNWLHPSWYLMHIPYRIVEIVTSRKHR